MVDPISDDELHRLRKAADSFDSALNDWRHNCGKEHLTPTPLSQSEWHLLHEAKKCDGLPELLARLDAAESRAAEMQRRNALLADMLKEQGDMLSDVMVKHGEIPPC